MNWTVSGIGKAGKLAANIETQMKAVPQLATHDSAFRDAALAVVKDALSSKVATGVYRVECSGVCGGATSPRMSMSVSVSIEPVAGWVE